MAGAPLGNQNSTREKRLLTATIRRELIQNPEDALAIAQKLIQSAKAGEPWAVKELIDRVDGKAHQTVGGDDEQDPIRTVSEILIRAVDATRDRPSTEG